MALEIGVRWELRNDANGGDLPKGRAVSSKTLEYLDAQRMGTKAFDEAEQGPRLEVLPDRRMRRYMIWALERSRARSLGSTDDLTTLLYEAPSVELTFTKGHLA